jgi:hypothetical protein
MITQYELIKFLENKGFKYKTNSSDIVVDNIIFESDTAEFVLHLNKSILLYYYKKFNFASKKCYLEYQYSDTLENYSIIDDEIFYHKILVSNNIMKDSIIDNLGNLRLKEKIIQDDKK